LEIIAEKLNVPLDNPSSENMDMPVSFLSQNKDTGDDPVGRITILLRSTVRNKDQLPESDREFLAAVLKNGLKALEEDPKAVEVTGKSGL
jgi:hypothetical protein